MWWAQQHMKIKSFLWQRGGRGERELRGEGKRKKRIENKIWGGRQKEKERERGGVSLRHLWHVPLPVSYMYNNKSHLMMPLLSSFSSSQFAQPILNKSLFLSTLGSLTCLLQILLGKAKPTKLPTSSLFCDFCNAHTRGVCVCVWDRENFPSQVHTCTHHHHHHHRERNGKEKGRKMRLRAWAKASVKLVKQMAASGHLLFKMLFGRCFTVQVEKQKEEEERCVTKSPIRETSGVLGGCPRRHLCL